MNDQDPRPAVVEHVSVLRWGQRRAHPYGNATDFHDAKESCDPFGNIEREHSHEGAHAHAELFEGVSDLIDFLGNFPESHFPFQAV